MKIKKIKSNKQTKFKPIYKNPMEKIGESVENQRIERELHECEFCGIKFNAHRLACHIIYKNIKEDEIMKCKTILKIYCPHCGFEYDLEVSAYYPINN